MSPSERITRARLAGLTRALNDPTHAGPERARMALEASWLRKAQERWPDDPPAEQRRRARILRKQHYVRMSALGVKARAR